MSNKLKNSTCTGLVALERQAGGVFWCSRFAPKELTDRRPEGEVEAVAQLLTAATAGGSGGARTGNRGGAAEGSCAVQQLHGMYSAAQPPPVSALRHPQVRREAHARPRILLGTNCSHAPDKTFLCLLWN